MYANIIWTNVKLNSEFTQHGSYISEAIYMLESEFLKLVEMILFFVILL